MVEQISSQRIIERGGRFLVTLTDIDPCPQECPFLETLETEVIKSSESRNNPSLVARWLMKLVGRQMQEPEKDIHTTQKCKFTAFAGAYPMQNLMQDVLATSPEDAKPQDMNCPSDIMVEVDETHVYATIGDKQLPPLPR